MRRLLLHLLVSMHPHIICCLFAGTWLDPILRRGEKRYEKLSIDVESKKPFIF
ncbi:hypothetical protein SynMITS9220_00235 [Synechococcus sp. MIT S9220]|nr:hypothetical protein SynMITS9220_00235 [Synechococcus sp. MIT S9220]